MAPEVQETPFVKQLASSDRKTREDALESLRTYLLYNRHLTEIELLKLWRGLFFCLYHTPHPTTTTTTTQSHLPTTLASLLLPLPTPLFTPFLNAFWTTIITEYTSIPQLRLDKYLTLIRCYISASFRYLALHAWDATLLVEWRGVMEGAGGAGGEVGAGGEGERGEGKGEEGKGKEEKPAPLSPRDMKVADGIRYHVLDIWVDELVKVAADEKKVEEKVLESIMAPVRRLGQEGRTKVVRGRARDVLRDERLREIVSMGGSGGDEGDDDDETWEGIED